MPVLFSPLLTGRSTRRTVQVWTKLLFYLQGMIYNGLCVSVEKTEWKSNLFCKYTKGQWWRQEQGTASAVTLWPIIGAWCVASSWFQYKCGSTPLSSPTPHKSPFTNCVIELLLLLLPALGPFGFGLKFSHFLCLLLWLTVSGCLPLQLFMCAASFTVFFGCSLLSCPPTFTLSQHLFSFANKFIWWFWNSIPCL